MNIYCGRTLLRLKKVSIRHFSKIKFGVAEIFMVRSRNLATFRTDLNGLTTLLKWVIKWNVAFCINSLFNHWSLLLLVSNLSYVYEGIWTNGHNLEEFKSTKPRHIFYFKCFGWFRFRPYLRSALHRDEPPMRPGSNGPDNNSCDDNNCSCGDNSSNTSNSLPNFRDVWWSSSRGAFEGPWAVQ